MTANQLNRIIYENIITSVRQDDHLIRRHQFKKKNDIAKNVN